MLILWSLLAAGAAVGNEIWMRSAGGFRVGQLALEVPLVFALAQVVSRSNSFVGGVILFSLSVALLRAAASLLIFRESPTPSHIAALLLLVGASVVKSVWR